VADHRLLNTTLTFPIAWHNSKLDGVTGRVSTVNMKGFQAYWTFGHTRARYYPPEDGGLIPQGAPKPARAKKPAAGPHGAPKTNKILDLLKRRDGVTLTELANVTEADIDGKNLEDCTPVQLVDVDGDGQIDFVLVGDGYKNHWYEVFSLEQGTWKMIFSGLGYWL
jgi:hypothetical protein